MMAISVDVFIKPETPVSVKAVEHLNSVFGGPGIRLTVGMIDITGTPEQLQVIAKEIMARVKEFEKRKGVA